MFYEGKKGKEEGGRKIKEGRKKEGKIEEGRKEEGKLRKEGRKREN